MRLGQAHTGPSRDVPFPLMESLMANFYTSPDVRNYTLPTGIFSFKPDDETDYVDLGAVSQASMSITVTKLTHKIARGGVISEDYSVIQSVSANGSATLDELTPQNWALFLLGDPVLDTDGQYSVQMLSNTNKSGYLRFVGDNDFGVQYNFEAYVTLTPAGDVTILNVDGNAFATLPVEFTINKDPVTDVYPTFNFPADKI